MPTYEYLCEACDHRFEEFQSITAKARRKCPACAKNRLRRLIGGGSAILFMGSGFYRTDYRSKAYKEAQAKEKDSPPDSCKSCPKKGKGPDSSG